MTLPQQSHAVQCNEQEWNKALSSQQTLDQRYNLLASQYNLWLPNFQHAVFLHQEFTQSELQFLWDSNRHDIRTKIAMQLESAQKASRDVINLLFLLDETPKYIVMQTEQWFQLGEKCKNEGLMSNYFSAELYLKSNQELKGSLDVLRRSLQTMQNYYDYEISALSALTEITSSP
ncbi:MULTISPECIES: hypothetical protein [Gammaproteobacteria]|nr:MULTISPECIES: hypothetical protein [Vibrio]